MKLTEDEFKRIIQSGLSSGMDEMFITYEEMEESEKQILENQKLRELIERTIEGSHMCEIGYPENNLAPEAGWHGCKSCYLQKLLEESKKN